MNLGTLALPRERWRELSGALEAGVTVQQVLFAPEPDIAALAKALLASKEVKPGRRPGSIPPGEDVEADELLTIKVGSLNTSNSRSLGPELVGHAFYQRLGFPEMLAECGLDAYQRDLAEAVIVGRLVARDSDLGTWHWLRSRTSLPELLVSDLEKAGKDAVYESADRLWQHRTRLQAGLRERESALYPRGETVILYDLTNTHFEGRCLENALAKRGHSKQKRSDCPLVTLADVLKRLQEDGGSLFEGVKPTLVMDRLKEQRLLVDLEKICRAIDKNNLRDCAKANQRIGRLLQRYPSIAPRYQITLAWVEAAFKALKSDLGLRPVRHHGEDRTRAHLFVSVLAYHLLASIERTLRMNGDRRSWATILAEWSTHQRSTVGLRDEKDEVHEVRLSGIPEPVHQEIYRLLAVKNPIARRQFSRTARL